MNTQVMSIFFCSKLHLRSLSRMVIFAIPIPDMTSPSSLPTLIPTKNHSLGSAIVSSMRETGMAAVDGTPAGKVRVSNVDTTTSMPTERELKEGDEIKQFGTHTQGLMQDYQFILGGGGYQTHSSGLVPLYTIHYMHFRKPRNCRQRGISTSQSMKSLCFPPSK